MRRLATVFVVSGLTVALGIAPASALPDPERKCLETVAKEGGRFVNKLLSRVQKCRNKNLRAPESCPQVSLDGKIAELVVKLRNKIGFRCYQLDAANFRSIGYPGKCPPATPGGAFTLDDLQNCIQNSHRAIVDRLIATEYGATAGPLADATLLKCQAEIAKTGRKLVHAIHTAVTKCRRDLLRGKVSGFAAKSCAAVHPTTKAKIDKAEAKARTSILAKCTDAEIAALDVNAAGVADCDPKATTAAAVADCIVTTHRNAVDNPEAAAPADIIDFEYATPLSCGDEILNTTIDPHDLDEECDGAVDAACPGQCGAPHGPFPCLCLNKKRQRISERAEGADGDVGWTGISHDQRVVSGAGYVLDLYECDGVSDVECIVGPNCSGAPHAPCANDAQCAALGQGTCRKERTAVGKHCNLDIQQVCTSDADCPGAGNYCVVTPHGPPLPLAAAGVAVCASTFFVEDITGTTNLATGATAIRIRQETTARFGPTTAQPCPVCGGFCNAPVGGDRRNCTTDADCPSGRGCVTDLICSAGPNADKECRPGAPFGGSNGVFGVTSIDCPAGTGLAGTIDTDFDPATTGTVQRTPQYQCDAPGFGSKVCLGGSNDGRACVADSTCPGATCGHQCYCPTKGGGPGVLEQPNACEAACLGGANDAAPCTVDSQCPGGVCHLADCRLNPADPDGADEGVCTAGPLLSLCSVTTFTQCNSDADCRPPPAGSCAFCRAGETCVIGFRQCFPNSGFSRTGVASPDNPTLVAAYCIEGIASAAINTVSGFPGPGSQRYPADRVTTGF